jgi:glucose/arabinose dehydrogenase
MESPNGKLLRLTPEGEIPDDNPKAGNPVFISGIRNTQGWDWPDENDAGLIWFTDHGPSGEMLRRGHDEVSVAKAGQNLGWPDIYGCETYESMVSPIISWKDAVPPGGAAIYKGNSIPGWRNSFIIGTLGSRHLQRVVIENDNLKEHEVYLQDQIGRIREVIMGNDGELYITTSNCDGRGNCPSDKDMILRITSQ